MTPDEIADILQRLDKNDQDHAKIYRLLYLILGAAVGTGAIGASQLLGA